MKKLLILFVLFSSLIGGQAVASNQKLDHGAGTLPHLNLALSVESGWTFPTPLLSDLCINAGVGDRVQLGVSGSVLLWYNSIDLHSLFNVLKTPDDSDFLSIYFNLGYSFGVEIPYFPNRYTTVYIIRPGIAFEHRFGKDHRIGFYLKTGIAVLVGNDGNTEHGWVLDSDLISLDIRAGFQALLGKRFSLALEPMLYVDLTPEQGLLDESISGYKLSLSWTFDLEQTTE